MPHEYCPCCLPALQRTRATHRVSPPPRSPPTLGAPRRRLGACTLARLAASTPRVCSVPTP
eukprot:6396926-Prymnesium_polylepis.1